MARITCRYVPWAGAFFIALLVSLTACGIKGRPVPPARTPPAPARDLRAVVDGNQIHLTWTLAKEDVEGKSALAGFHVFRWRRALADPACPGCPKVYERIADIDAETGAEEAPDRIRLSHDASLEPGYRYAFKVMGYTKDGLISKDSNLLEFDY